MQSQHEASTFSEPEPVPEVLAQMKTIIRAESAQLLNPDEVDEEIWNSD